MARQKEAPRHRNDARGFLWYRVKNSIMQIPAESCNPDQSGRIMFKRMEFLPAFMPLLK